MLGAALPQKASVALPRVISGVLGTWGRPPDVTARVALGLAVAVAVAALFGRGRSILGAGPTPVPKKPFLWAAAFAAAMLSVLYIAEYLRGGPRIIDATTYFLQGRALSEGSFTWPVLEPSASFRGRFLLYRDGAMGGIFPPGYPLLLAFGFALGAPMVVGPALAALIVVATYRLARTIAEDALPSGAASELAEPIARGAALLSVICAALRYHTADTMSHGAAALGVTVALEAALRARRGSTSGSTERSTDRPAAGSTRGSAGDAARAPNRGAALVAGLAIGAVAATRPVSALPIGLVVLALFAFFARSSVERRALVARAGLGLVPGLLFFVLAQHAVTGAWLTSTQRMYYATSDGPPGCFRWGFGAGTGCLFEHGDFVRDRLAGGYGAIEAALTTLRRLRVHLLDVANLEPLALVVLLPLAQRSQARRAATGAALALVALQVLAYAPFYFDGSYPGGGARFFADVLPAEHALVVVAIGVAAARSRGAAGAHARAFTRGLFAFAALSLAGFAVHASFEHGKLRDRDGGRPMFEPDVLQAAHVGSGLLFVTTDHGFDLAADPGARVKSGLVVARQWNDDRDRLLYDRLGRPPTWIYHFDVPKPPKTGAPGAPPSPAPAATPTVLPWAPPPISGETYRFEAEAEWPALAQRGGFAAPAYTDACASHGRALVVVPVPASGVASATISLPVPSRGRWSVTLHVVQSARLPNAPPPAPATKGAARIGGKTVEWNAGGSGCSQVPPLDVALEPPSATLVVEARGGSIGVDRITLHRARCRARPRAGLANPGDRHEACFAVAAAAPPNVGISLTIQAERAFIR
jgi:hypothetical protein